jgi:hypothetical protein
MFGENRLRTGSVGRFWRPQTSSDHQVVIFRIKSSGSGEPRRNRTFNPQIKSRFSAIFWITRVLSGTRAILLFCSRLASIEHRRNEPEGTAANCSGRDQIGISFIEPELPITSRLAFLPTHRIGNADGETATPPAAPLEGSSLRWRNVRKIKRDITRIANVRACQTPLVECE